MRKLLLLFLTPLMLASCLKDEEAPEPTVCLAEPNFIGKWEQISSLENRFDDKGTKTQETFIEYNENDDLAIKLEFSAPDDEDNNKNETDKEHIAKGKYQAKVYDKNTQKIIVIDDMYKLLNYYANTPLPVIELYVNEKSTRYFQKFEQSENGTILTLANTIIEGEGTDKVVTATVLRFKSKP